MTEKIDFIHENTKKALGKMVLPLMAAMFLNMAYNLVDSLWIGNLLGERAYAALTNSTPVILILNALAMGMANGTAILLSQAVGAHDREKIERQIATSLVMTIGLSLGLTILLEIFLKPVMVFLHTPKTVMHLACGYLAVYALGYLPVCLYCYFTAVLRSFGNSIFQAAAMGICTILNGALDPLFIHFIGFTGAAAATVLSQTLCLGIMVLYLYKKKFFVLKLAYFDHRELLPLLKKGIPSAFQQSIPAVSTSFVTALAAGWGISALAAYGIIGKLEILLFYPAMALNMALTSIVGQCAGGNRYDRAKDYRRLALGYGGAVMGILSVLMLVFAGPLSRLFLDSTETARIVRGYFGIVSIGYVLNTVTNCCLGSLNGKGKPAKSLLCMIFYYVIVRMPLAWLLSGTGLGLSGIWAAVLISHIAAAAAALGADREPGKTRRKENRRDKRQEAGDLPGAGQ